MPNWSTNIYAVKSATKNVLNFVNEGLKNLGVEPKDNVKEAIVELWEHHNVTMETFRPTPETFHKYDTTNPKRKRDETDRDTKKPLFYSDEEYEIYCKEYDDAVNYQKETYGVVGWYGYNVNVAFGCKWNANVELEKYYIDEDNDVVTIYMTSETPWCYPCLWLGYIKSTFDLNVFLYAHEEFDLYHFFEEYGGETIEGYHAEDMEENMLDSNDFDDLEEYNEEYDEFVQTVCDYKHFYDYVDNYTVELKQN